MTSMEIYSALLIVGVSISTITVLANAYALKRKVRSRRTFIETLAQDRAFLEELRRYHEAQAMDQNEFERLHAIVMQRLSQLSAEDRARVESSLYQPSQRGRRRYIERLAEEAESQQASQTVARA